MFIIQHYIMRISIITINYNNKEGLEKTFKSIANQNYKDFEYIVIDGKSTDGSIEIINRYKSIINFLLIEKDNGIYDAMNKGIIHSNGEYLLFLNSGDILLNKNSVKKMVKNNFTEDLIVYVQKFINKNGIIRNGPFYKKEIVYNPDFFYNSTLPHQSVLIKRKLFKEIGMYNISYRIVSDWIFWYQAIIDNNVSIKLIKDSISLMGKDGISSNIENCRKEMLMYLTNREDINIERIMEWILKNNYKNHIYNMCNTNKLSKLLIKVAFYISKRI